MGAVITKYNYAWVILSIARFIIQCSQTLSARKTELLQVNAYVNIIEIYYK